MTESHVAAFALPSPARESVEPEARAGEVVPDVFASPPPRVVPTESPSARGVRYVLGTLFFALALGFGFFVSAIGISMAFPRVVVGY